MKIEPLPLPEILLLTPRLHSDARGIFFEAWNARAFAKAGIPSNWKQDNVSSSEQGVLRGLHCQVQQTQGKLVQCLAGSIFDVAVDVRAHSATFGHWCGARLDDASRAAMWVPPGFAHGYYVLGERATVHYKVTDYYAAEHERCLRWDDPDVGVSWPLVEGRPPLISTRDQEGDSLSAARVWFP